MTTQSLMKNPFKALVMETRDVLTMVVSMVERKRAIQTLHSEFYYVDCLSASEVPKPNIPNC